MITNENYTSWIVIHINWTQVSNLFDFSRTSCFRPNLFGTRISNTRPCLERTEKCLLFFFQTDLIWYGPSQTLPFVFYKKEQHHFRAVSKHIASVQIYFLPISMRASARFPGTRAKDDVSIALVHWMFPTQLLQLTLTGHRLQEWNDIGRGIFYTSPNPTTNFHQATYIKASSWCHMVQGQS